MFALLLFSYFVGKLPLFLFLIHSFSSFFTVVGQCVLITVTGINALMVYDGTNLVAHYEDNKRQNKGAFHPVPLTFTPVPHPRPRICPHVVANWPTVAPSAVNWKVSKIQRQNNIGSVARTLIVDGERNGQFHGGNCSIFMFSFNLPPTRHEDQHNSNAIWLCALSGEQFKNTIHILLRLLSFSSSSSFWLGLAWSVGQQDEQTDERAAESGRPGAMNIVRWKVLLSKGA